MREPYRLVFGIQMRMIVSTYVRKMTKGENTLKVIAQGYGSTLLMLESNLLKVV